jgi:hypothetical protein
VASERPECETAFMKDNDSTSDDSEPDAVAPKVGLGDLAEAFFKSLGVTEERYKAVKVKLHLDPNCNCADRKKWLNEVGAQLGVDGVVMKMAKWMDRPKR